MSDLLCHILHIFIYLIFIYIIYIYIYIYIYIFIFLLIHFLHVSVFSFNDTMQNVPHAIGKIPAVLQKQTN